MIMFSREKNMIAHIEVILRNEVVERVHKVEFIRVIVVQQLNWKDHITMISQQKKSKSCGIIYRICNNLDIKSKKVIYYSLIHPYTRLTASMYGHQHIKPN